MFIINITRKQGCPPISVKSVKFVLWLLFLSLICNITLGNLVNKSWRSLNYSFNSFLNIFNILILNWWHKINILFMENIWFFVLLLNFLKLWLSTVLNELMRAMLLLKWLREDVSFFMGIGLSLINLANIKLEFHKFLILFILLFGHFFAVDNFWFLALSEP